MSTWFEKLEESINNGLQGVSLIHEESLEAKNKFNDTPEELPFLIYSNTQKAIGAMWIKNNGLHRENDKPAYIIFDKNKKASWSLNGLEHRDGNKFSSIDEYTVKWKLFNTYHCVTGPSVISLDNAEDNVIESEMFFLYGIALEKDFYKKVIVSAYEEKISLWVALFYKVGLLKTSNLKLINDLTDGGVPLRWILKSCKVDEISLNKLAKNIKFQQQQRNTEVFQPPISIDSIVQIVNWEKNELSSL